MAWRRKPLYSRYVVRFYDRIKGEFVEIERLVEEAEGFHNFGRFSYKGERLNIIQGAPGFYSEDYPPPLYRCRTKAAKSYWQEQESTHSQL